MVQLHQPLFFIYFYPEILSLFLLLADAVEGGAPGYHHAPYCGEKAQRLLNMPFMKDLISPNNPYFPARI